MAYRLRGIAAVTLALLGSAVMSMPASCYAQLRSVRSAADPNAGIVWLRQEETMTVHADGTTRADFHNTGRILSDQGLENGDVSISYDTTSQTVTGVRARTIRSDGSVLSVRPADIHQTSPYSDFTLYDDTRNVGFSLPGIEPGTTIDYQYTVLTRTPLLKGRFSENWWLGGADQCRVNRFTLTLPAALSLRSRVHNGTHISFTQRLSPDGRTRTLSWENRDAPAVAPEPLMPPEETYLPWIEVSTWPDWQSVAQWYQGLSHPQTALTPALTTLARQLTAGKTTESDKAQALFYWVEKHTRYVAIEGGLSAYQPHAAAVVCRNRYGDCKDMATLLITLLHAAGISTAWPALLDTELKQPLHGHLAMPDTFDHVIVRADLDGKPYWFDSTAELASFGDIPGSDRGVEALVVRSGHGAFETVPTGGPEADRSVYDKTIVLHADGSAECRTAVRDEGDAALSTREEFHGLRPDQWAGHFQNMLSDQAGARLEKFSLSSCSDLSTPLTYGADYRSPLWAIRTGGLLLISDTLAYTPPTDARTRTHSLLMDSTQQTDYTVTVFLPAGYTIEAQPEDFDERMPVGEVRVTYRASPGRLVIHKVFTQKPGVVVASDYPHLVAAFDRIAAALKQPVILHSVEGPVSAHGRIVQASVP